MEHTNSKVFNKVTVLVFLIGIVVGFGSASLWLRRSKNVTMGAENAQPVSVETPGAQPGNPVEKGDTSSARISAAVSSGEYAITANDQPAGNTVSISSLTLAKGAWVAVHEDASGKPGKILGAQFFPASARAGSVELLRGTETGKKYYVMLHADDGDHAFDYIADLPLKDAAGEPVMHVFMAGAAGAAK